LCLWRLAKTQYYNQSFICKLSYNLYDGLSPQMRLHKQGSFRQSLLSSGNFAYSTNAKTFSGSGFRCHQSKWYRNSAVLAYSLSGSIPLLQMLLFENQSMVQLSDQKRAFKGRQKPCLFRQLIVSREKKVT
jgi:hypothetical protein